MRLVHYVPGWPPSRMQNGIVSCASVLAPALREQGCAVELLAGQKPEDETYENVTFLGDAAPEPRGKLLRAVSRRLSSSKTGGSAPSRIARAMLKSATLKGADILYMEESFGWYHAVARRIPQPVVVGLRGPWFMNGPAVRGDLTESDLKRIRAEGAGLERAAAVHAVSNFALEDTRRYYGLELPNATVIHNPAPTVRSEYIWQRDRADPDEILFIGRFDRHKGADILLHAFAAVAKERPQARLTFAGPCHQSIQVDGKAYDRRSFLEAFVPPAARERINFLGPVPNPELGPLRARAAVTVVCSRVETFGNVLAEAMAHGSPVVSTSEGALPELARDNIDALFAPSNNAEALAAKILEMLNDPQRAAQLGSSARQKMETEHAPARIAKLYLELFDSVLTADRRRPRQ